MIKRSLSLFFILCSGLILAAQDFAVEQLNASPRHHEWVDVKNDDRLVHCFVAYPEEATNTPAVIVIHENRGLTDWVRSVTDQFAAAGYLAIAPDLLSAFGEGKDQTSDFESSDAARTAIYELDPEQVTDDLFAIYEYISNVPAANGEVVVAGFCWGGSQTFRHATHNDQVKAFMVFYGTAPKDPEAFKRIQAPVYGFYGGNDQRVNATIPTTAAEMGRAGKTYEYEIYKKAGHAFMRRGDDPQGDKANRKARKKAWKRIQKILENL